VQECLQGRIRCRSVWRDKVHAHATRCVI